MKNYFISIFVLTVTTPLFGQLVDILPEPNSSLHLYYPNTGQLTDDQSNPVPDVIYYTDKCTPNLFLGEDIIHFVHLINDTIDTTLSTLRLDMTFKCNLMGENEESCGTIIPEEPTSNYINYFYDHCPDGITSYGTKRIIYEDAFSGIDVHFYSNELGLKSYIVIEPFANPNDIILHFDGQDSIEIDTTGWLELFLSGHSMDFPQATAYQIDQNNMTSPIGWLPEWTHLGNGDVGVTTYAYDQSKTLVLRFGGLSPPPPNFPGNLNWSTFYGGNGKEFTRGLVIDKNDNDNIYHVGHISSTNIVPKKGYQLSIGGSLDLFVTRIYSNKVIAWSTYYGGEGNEVPFDIDVSTNTNVYVVGKAENGMPFNSVSNIGTFKQTSYHGGESDGFIMAFRKSNGIPKWQSYFGGLGADAITTLEIDDSKNSIFIGGFTKSSINNTNCSSQIGKFPLCNSTGTGFFKTTLKGSSDIFLARFERSSHALLWSTYFGGQKTERVMDILSVKQNGLERLYICGHSEGLNVGFPVNSGTAGSFRQISNAQRSAFVTQFNSTFFNSWSTFYGGEGNDQFNSMAIDSDDNIIIIGETKSNNTTSCSPQAQDPKLPICTTSTSQFINSLKHSSSSAGLITKFNSSNVLQWSTYYSGNAAFGTSVKLFDIDIDANNFLFIAGLVQAGDYNGMDVYCPNSNLYCRPYCTQPHNYPPPWPAYVEDQDGALLMFKNTGELKWASHFGGETNLSFPGGESFTEIEISSTQELYFAGSSTQSKTPYKCPGTTANLLCDPVISNEDFILGSFDIATITTGINKNLCKHINAMRLFPNPTTGTSLSVEYWSEENELGNFTIYNLIGDNIESKRIPSINGLNLVKFDINSLIDGVYFLKLEISNRVYLEKFIVN